MCKISVKTIGLLFFLSSQVFAQQAALVSVDPVVEQQFTQTSPVIGRLVAIQSGTVAAQTNGTVSDILVQLGDKVSKGQVLATIDASTLLLQKQLSDSRLVESEARLKTAQAQYSLAVQELKRLEGLLDTANVSRAVYDDVSQQRNIASARVNEARAAINSSASNSKLAELELSYTSITAPFEGTVIAKMTEVGNYLQRGQAVVEIVSDDNLELEADIPSSRLSGLDPKATLSFSLDNGSQHTAKVRAIIPVENLRTRTRRVRFTPTFSDGAQFLANNQSATLLIPDGRNEAVLTVHKDAIVRPGPGQVVYVVAEDKAVATPIQTGQPIGTRLEILSGPKVGDNVVIRGNERLRPNQPVKIKQ